MRTAILGLDLGKTTAWARVSDGRVDRGLWRLEEETMGARFDHFEENLLHLLNDPHFQIRLAVAEAHRFLSWQANASHYGLLGITLAALHHVGTEPLIVQPARLKKWATGKGNAKKPAMIAAACEKTGCHITSHDEADAVLLALYGVERLRGAVV